MDDQSRTILTMYFSFIFRRNCPRIYSLQLNRNYLEFRILTFIIAI